MNTETTVGLADIEAMATVSAELTVLPSSGAGPEACNDCCCDDTCGTYD